MKRTLVKWKLDTYTALKARAVFKYTSPALETDSRPTADHRRVGLTRYHRLSDNHF